jgi:uncharacterized protein
MEIQGIVNYELIVKKSTIHGRGVFSPQQIKKRKKVGSLAGTITTIRKIRQQIKLKKSIAAVELDHGLALDATDFKNELCFINHSCRPNCYMRIINKHVEIYTLRSIKKNEELTCNYGETHHDGKLACNCGKEDCRGKL